MDPHEVAFISDVTSNIWWIISSFWLISGAMSTVASRLPPPTIITPENKTTTGSGITATRFYRILYHVTNFIAQNFSFAKNAQDPSWRRGIEMTLRILGSLVASGAAGSEAQQTLKKVSDIDAALKDAENDGK